MKRIGMSSGYLHMVLKAILLLTGRRAVKGFLTSIL